jgi:glycosyltransferase involved in cell wall biosynthesis
MKITIITVCYNSANTIGQTIASIASQNYSNKEYIIVDGGSTDSTMAIVKNAASVSSYISEPDKGIYDAMNKGLKLAKGDVIGLLNADDFYAADDVLSNIAEIFKDHDVQACFADLVYVDQRESSRVVRYWKSEPYQKGLFKSGWMPAHPTFFVRREVYEKYGLFNLDYKIAADFELLFRFIEQYQIKTVYLDKVLVKMRTGGTTNKSLKNIWAQNKEIIQTLRLTYPDFSVSKFILRKFLNRSKQFIQKP